MASSKPTAGRPGAWWTPGKEKKQQTSNSPHKLKEICIVDKTDGLKKPCCMEFNLKTNEILLTTSFNDPKTNIIDYVHRYKMDVSGF